MMTNIDTRYLDTLAGAVYFTVGRGTVEGIGYYLVYPPERARQPKIQMLREWMLGSAQSPAPG